MFPLGHGDSARPPQQGILVAPPRLVDGEKLPKDHPLAPVNIAQMRGSFLDPVTKFLPSKERS